MWMLGIGVGVVTGMIVGRWLAHRLRTSDRDGRALIALEHELYLVAREHGRSALEAHAADWRGSAIFRRYPAIARDEVVRAYLVDALVLLADDNHAHDLDQLLSASLRIMRKRRHDGRDPERRNKTLETIRRNVLAMRRGGTPVGAGRHRRDTYDVKPSATDFTRALVELSRPRRGSATRARSRGGGYGSAGSGLGSGGPAAGSSTRAM